MRLRCVRVCVYVCMYVCVCVCVCVCVSACLTKSTEDNLIAYSSACLSQRSLFTRMTAMFNTQNVMETRLAKVH